MPQSPAKQFSGIFVCYRREDSSGDAGRLFDKLVIHFGKDRIFMDIVKIEPGEDFDEAIERAVSSCQIFIVIIGRHWLTASDGNIRRLDNPKDFVRAEIAAAVKRDIRIIPVLVQGASMPQAEDLPEELTKLTRKNAHVLNDRSWQYDVEKLIDTLKTVLAKQGISARRAPEHKKAIPYLLIGIILCALILLGGYQYLSNSRKVPVVPDEKQRPEPSVSPISETTPTPIRTPSSTRPPPQNSSSRNQPKSTPDVIEAMKEQMRKEDASNGEGKKPTSTP